MKAINYEQIFKMFTDEDRIGLEQPYFQEGYYVASDAHSAIRIDATKKELPFNFESKKNIITIYNNAYKGDLIALNIKSLRDRLIPEMEPLEIICLCCNGDGVVEYEFFYDKKNYTIEYDCPVCNSNGYTTDKTGKMQIKDMKVFKIKGIFFAYNQLDRLLKVAEILELKTINYFIGKEDCPQIFLVADLEILVMPVSKYTMEPVTNIELPTESILK